MEGRERQEASVIRRSSTFSGRQVPLEMGKVRVGGSGRSVPALISAASRRTVISSHPAPPAALSPYVQPNSDNELFTGDGIATSTMDLLKNEEQKTSTNAPEEKAIKLHSENLRPLELHDQKTLTRPPASADAGTFVSCMPSVAKLRRSFTARELALFTQRLETSDHEGTMQARYHVASHPNSTTMSITSPVHHSNQEHARNKETLPTYKSSSPRRDSLVESSWKRVDTSIDQMYEDPSLDMVQLHLLHSHNTTSGQKKRKLMERERLLAAAAGLREQQSDEQRRHEQLQQRKLRLQKMSEAIRLQNQRAIRASPPENLSERHVKASRRVDTAPTLPGRKPPVPRLSRNGVSAKSPQYKRTPKPRDDESRPQAGVSTSNLLDFPSDSSGLTTQQRSEDDQKDANEAMTPLRVEISTGKRNSAPVTTPRVSKKKKQVITHPKPREDQAATRAREERRAIAREYMQLQKQSRRLRNAKAKEQSQREQEKRQQQLEILEATRLKHLRLSKTRRKDRKKCKINDDPMVLEHDRTAASTTYSRNPSLNDMSIDTSRFVTEGDKKLVLDEPQQDNENDQTIGNLKTSEVSSHSDTKPVGFGGQLKDNWAFEQEASQNTEADERVRKLLELREKAAALSTRLSSLRNPTETTERMKVIEEQTRLVLGTNDMIELADDDVQASASDTGNRSLVNDNVHDADDNSEHEQEENDKKEGENNGSSHCSESEREQTGSKHSCSSSSEYDARGSTDQVEMTQRSLVDEGIELLTSFTRTRREGQQNQAFFESFGMDEVNGDDEDLDIRSIGVYNIGVVWPLAPQNESVSEKGTMRSPSASSASSSSSAASSSSAVISRREQWLGDLNDSHGEKEEDNEEAFEVAFYQQLKTNLQVSSVLVDERNDATTSDDREATEERGKGGSESESESHFNTFAMRGPERRFDPTDRGANRARERNFTANQPAGLMRLIRETDDSLSVIDRAAKKMYHDQLERAEREKEKELQERIEVEKKELLEKDLALKAVMASITGKYTQDSGVSDPDDDVEVQFPEMQSPPSSQYKRLEEIMEEVKKERARENKEKSKDLIGESTIDEHKVHEAEPPRLQSTKRSIQLSDGMPVSPPSAFWDQLVAETTDNEFKDYPNHENFNQSPEINDAALSAQRERLAEQTSGHTRMHSPRTLSRRLMAAIDYQEAIFDAHLQLSMMKHTHELETVQAGTLTLAQAFQEEMKDNVASHQLALDRVTLEKKFDGAMHDVMQQLNTIRQVDEQERAATKMRMEQELKLANLRECSVQTEASQRADAATSAALYIDTSTSPVRFAVDAAVQHDLIERKTQVTSSVARTNSELEYASDDSYGETFEKESQLQVDQQPHEKSSSLDAHSIVESASRSLSKSGNGSGSDIQSMILEHDDLEESEESEDVVDEEHFGEESAAKSAAESICDEEVGKSEDNKAEDSVSLDYEDDFESSSPKFRVISSQLSQEVDDDVEDELKVSRSYERSGNSGDIEEEVGDRDAVEEEVGSEDVESDDYSSQFDDMKNTKNSVLDKQIATVMHEADTTTVQAQERHRGDDFSVVEISDSISIAYVRDLERRKQAEESLLNLRLQTVEQKYQRQVRQLETTLGNGSDLMMRKETLTMAFMAEKANVASVKAASTARYYQDLHTFRSLSLDWPHAVGNGSESGQLASYLSEHLRSFIPSAVAPSTVQPVPSKSLTQVDEVSARRDEYTDEFASDIENGDVDDVKEETTDKSEAGESGSIVSEHSKREDNSKEPSDVLETSEVAEDAEIIEQDDSNSVQEEDDQYEDEFASISDDVSVQKDMIVESENGHQDNDDSIHGDSDYGEDFASVSESSLNSKMVPVNYLEIDEQAVEEDEKASDTGMILNGSEIVGMEQESRVSDEEVPSEMIEPDQREYSDDVENGQLEQSLLPHAEQVLEEQSGSVQVGQSSSDDSSTTKLLVTEVASLRELVRATSNTRTGTEKRLIAKKKAKVEDLLQAKAQLLNQQKEAFRHDEEKRQVDVLARMALGVDVVSELRRAKDEIAQQLASEFDTLQQTYPILKGDSLVANEVLMKERTDVVPTSSVMSKLFGKNVSDRSTVIEEGNDEYEAESFEEEQDDDDDEVASEVPSKQSDIDEDEVISVFDEEEEEKMIDEKESDGAKRDSEDYENDFEDGYENESFDEAESVPDPLDEYGNGNVSIVEVPAEDTIKEEETLEKPGYNDEDAYSDEAFASESFTNEAPPGSGADNLLSQDPATIGLGITEIVTGTEETSAELTEAVEKVVAQLRDKQATNSVTFAKFGPDHDHAIESALNDSKALVSSVSVSLSRDEEEESLTRSIEERTARLEALKHQIEARKSEILAVQKQMRAERRKEKLVSEEKMMWDEMESVERLLRADEAELALCRQRNRLEVMNLEARQLDHSINGKPNENMCKQENDLLLGFDHVEEVQIDVKQQRFSRLGHRGAQIIRGFDLLDGYTYIEAVEPITSDAFVPIVATREAIIQEAGAEGRRGVLTTKNNQPDTYFIDSQGEQGNEGNYVLIEQEADNHEAVSKLEVSDETSSPLLQQDSLEQQSPVDLLAGYEFVEVAEAVSDAESGMSSANLMVDYDYVEIVEAVNIATVLHDIDYNEVHQEARATDASDADHEELDEFISKYESEGDGVDKNELTTESVDCQPPQAPSHTSTEGDNAKSNAGSVGKFIEDEEPIEDNNEFDSIGAMIVVDSDIRRPSDEGNPPQSLRDAEVFDRVAALLYTDLFQELDGAIMTTIRDCRRRVQDEQQLQKTTNMILSSVGNIPPITAAPFSDNLDKQLRKAVYADSIIEESSFNVEEDVQESLGGNCDQESVRDLTQNVESSVELTKHQCIKVSAEYKAEKVVREPNDDYDKALPSERIADAIFAAAIDEIVDSELQLWSHQRPIAPSTIIHQAFVKRSLESGYTLPSVVQVTSEAKKPIPSEDPRARDRVLTQRILDQLDVVDGEIHLPALSNLSIDKDSSTAHVLYETVEDLARGCLSAIQQSSPCEYTLDNASILAVINRHVQAEIEELFAIRAQSEHELERQLQLVSDDAGAETGLTGDVLLSQNCIASSVNSIVSKVQSDLSRTTEELSTATHATRPLLLPRTPLSRAKRTSILSSLQAQQAQELQQRITGMILSDLLRDTGLPSSCHTTTENDHSESL